MRPWISSWTGGPFQAAVEADELVERSGLTRNRAEKLMANANLLL